MHTTGPRPRADSVLHPVGPGRICMCEKARVPRVVAVEGRRPRALRESLRRASCLPQLARSANQGVRGFSSIRSARAPTRARSDAAVPPSLELPTASRNRSRRGIAIRHRHVSTIVILVGGASPHRATRHSLAGDDGLSLQLSEEGPRNHVVTLPGSARLRTRCARVFFRSSPNRAPASRCTRGRGDAPPAKLGGP